MRITFYGAAQTTTGSMHLVEANGKRILLDCGLYQGHRKEAFEKNRTLPIDPKTINYVILSHAHIDHSGNLPQLVRQGFRGRVFARQSTCELCDIMLRDSCFLQKRDLDYINKSRRREGKKLFEPLYDESDINALMQLFVPTHMHEPREIAQPYVEQNFQVSMPLFNLGFKESSEPLGTRQLAQTDILLSLLASPTSRLYRSLMDEKLINSSFSYEMKNEGIDKEEFEIAQRAVYGDAISSLNNVSSISNAITDHYFGGTELFAYIDAVAQTGVEDVTNRLSQVLDVNNCTLSVVKSSETEV